MIPPAVIGADGSATPVEVSAQIDSDALSDEIARKVSALSPNDFDIIVDDEGCRSLAEAVAEKLDYDALQNALPKRTHMTSLPPPTRRSMSILRNSPASYLKSLQQAA